MRFHLFTRRTTYASLRLRFLARGMQVFGVLIGVLEVTTAKWMATAHLNHSLSPEMRAALIRSVLVHGLFAAISYFLVGRALRRRERWSGYAAAIAIGLPALLRVTNLVSVPGANFSTAAIDSIALITVTLIATVWRELGSVPASAILDHGGPPEPTIPLTPRNRGYGEPRSLQNDEHEVPTFTSGPNLAPVSKLLNDTQTPSLSISPNTAPTPTV